MLTRYENSRLKFCERQHAILKQRTEAKEAKIKSKIEALEADLETAHVEYSANLAELRALEAKRDAN